MGQAFDADGNVLGEAYGATRADVLRELERKHMDADRIEISKRLSESKSRDRMMQFFRYDHLPERLRAASEPFCRLAEKVEAEYPSNPERTVTLRKLLEAKDAAVRTLLYEA